MSEPTITIVETVCKPPRGHSGMERVSTDRFVVDVRLSNDGWKCAYMELYIDRNRGTKADDKFVAATVQMLKEVIKHLESKQ